ncbi:MAG: tRNA (adenosine(37)-N6)-dimethylallyltransferase MiaA [Bacteroidota bacterium]
MGLVVSIVGPTAVGKTDLALRLATHFKTEIISADSRQIYSELEIATAKPSLSQLEKVKHHFINSHSLKQEYSAGLFEREAKRKIKELLDVYPLVFVVGGSGLYFKAIWEGFDEMPVVDQKIRNDLNLRLSSEGVEALGNTLKKVDPEYHEKVDLQNGQRIVRALEVIFATGKPFSNFRKSSYSQNSFDELKIGLCLPRDVLYQRINQRVDQMIADGLFDEAKTLYSQRNLQALQTVGYKEIFDFMDGAYDREEAVRLLKRNTRRFAKRQMTWFRKFDDITWFEPFQFDEMVERIEQNCGSN